MASYSVNNSANGVSSGDYMIVDVGANLTNKKFARDLDAVIDRAKEAGDLEICHHLFSLWLQAMVYFWSKYSLLL